MACGICPLLNNIAGLKDYILIDGFNSIIFNNEEEMKESIIKLITNSELRNTLGKNAGDFINENCTLKKITNNFLNKFYQ